MATKGMAPSSDGFALNWTNDKCPRGNHRVGWLAGPMHGIVVHKPGISKPCLKKLCGNATSCPGCAQTLETEWIGYVPVYREDAKQFVIIIHEQQAEMVDRIELHARVRWGRNEADGEGIWCRPETTGPKWHSAIPARMRPANLARWLLRLWKIPGIEEAVTRLFTFDAFAPSRVEPIPPAPHVPAVAPGLSENVADAMCQMELGVSLGEVFKRRGIAVTPEVPPPNGKHKRKAKP